MAKAAAAAGPAEAEPADAKARLHASADAGGRERRGADVLEISILRHAHAYPGDHPLPLPGAARVMNGAGLIQQVRTALPADLRRRRQGRAELGPVLKLLERRAGRRPALDSVHRVVSG